MVNPENSNLEPTREQMAFHPVSKQDGQVAVGELVLDSRDLTNCFNLFLGRMPANPSADRLRTTNLAVLLRDIFETDEFKTAILHPLLLRETLPHSTLAEVPMLPLIDWAQRRLPIGTSTRRTAGGARTWAQLLELLLSDVNLVSVAPELVAAEVDGILRARLESEPLSRVRRSVVGIIDGASGFEVRGWAVDLCDKSTPVILEFY